MTAAMRQRARIVEYYKRSRFDYWFVWMRGRNRSMHYGYWDATTRNHSQSLSDMNRELAAFAGVRDGMRILDAGCGIGGSALWLAENFDVQVVGITLSPQQAATAQRLARRRKLQHCIEFHVADYCDTGFESESFDLVWAQESLCYAQPKAAFLREAYRLLRSGGRIAIEDGFRTARDLSAEGEALLLDWLDCWAIEDIDTVAEFAAQADVVGFMDFAHRDVSAHGMTSAHRLARAFTVFGIPAWIAYRLRMRSHIAHRNFLGARLQWLAFARRLWELGLVTARKP
ncbi:SAM-dependent methyltransferase [Nocardia sp. NPDC059228]|uniref:SAM-dependent methyltransferase n=1 Tax=Nocardia sp. NPDC059228 TaxID=3346777 RepID=UPI0036B24050